MDWITRSDAVQACLLTTVGALLVFGALPFPGGAALLAVALAVAAVLVFARSIVAPLWLGTTLLAIALLMLVTNPAGRLLERVLDPNAHVIAEGLLVALGLLRLAGPDAWPDTHAAQAPGPASHPGRAAGHGAGPAVLHGPEAVAVHAAKPSSLHGPEAAGEARQAPLGGPEATAVPKPAAVRGPEATAVHAAKPKVVRGPETAAGHQPDPLGGTGSTT